MEREIGGKRGSATLCASVCVYTYACVNAGEREGQSEIGNSLLS